MVARQRRGLRKPIILTAMLVLAVPVVSADTPTVATLCVYGALIFSFAWWARYFLRMKRAQVEANAIISFNRGFEAEEAGDFPMAMQWFTLSASVGNASAMNRIGLLHMNGLGVPANDAFAAEWFQKAIAHGDTAGAPANLRMALAGGQGDRSQQYAGGHRAEDIGRMTRADALEVFDLQEGATAADIRTAYLRLMQQVHPDHGGSTFFAKQLNEARSLLLAE